MPRTTAGTEAGGAHLPQVVEPCPDVSGDAGHTAIHQVVHEDIFFPAGKTAQNTAVERLWQAKGHGHAPHFHPRSGQTGPCVVIASELGPGLCQRCVG